jgi:histone H3/H4
MAKVSSKGAKGAKGVKKGGKKGKRSFGTYINRVNKNSKRGLTLSSKSVKILNSFVLDMFDKIATQAAALARANKKSTIRAAEIQTAVRLTLPADLAKHSISEASKAVTTALK